MTDVTPDVLDDEDGARVVDDLVYRAGPHDHADLDAVGMELTRHAVGHYVNHDVPGLTVLLFGNHADPATKVLQLTWHNEHQWIVRYGLTDSMAWVVPAANPTSPDNVAEATVREGTSSVRLRYAAPVTAVAFDDRNLVSCAGLFR